MRRWTVALLVAVLVVTASASVADAAKGRTGARADEPSIFSRVAVLLVNFTNQPSEPWAKADVERLFFTGERSVTSYYDELSEGQMSVTGQVFGYLKAGARYDGYCEYTRWARAARNSAAANGINLSQFTHVMYVFPYQPACKWNGYSRPGPNNGLGRDSWVNGLLTVFVAAHELGHNFGLGHAASMSCNINGIRVTVGGTCSTYDYGDPFDVMGYGATVRHMQAWHRWRLGFLHEDEVVTVAESGTYRISAAEFGGEHPRLLRIDRGNGTFFYLEFRQPFGQFDDFAEGAPVVNGVSIRIAAEGYYKDLRLLDATPQTCTFNDSSLALGETFRDASGRVRITTLDVGPGSAQVEIGLGESIAPTGSAGEGDPTEDPDLEAPSAVSNIAVQQVTGNLVAVSWAKATDNIGVIKYEVYTDDVLRGTTCDLRFRNVPMGGGRPHSVSVRAVDLAGNFGPFETISYTPPDFTSPGGMGRRIFTSVSGGKVTVSWRGATDNVGVAFYRVIKNGRILTDVDASARSYRDDSPGSGYLRYSVTAFDAAGNASRPLARKIYR